jgi:hypothetical protein
MKGLIDMRNRRTAIVMILVAAISVAICAAAFSQTTPGAQITLKLQNVPIADAIRQLLGQGYVIESGVTGTVSYVNATFPDKDSALRTLLKSVPGVTYRKDESGTYIISMKQAPTVDTTPQPAVDTSNTVSAEPTLDIKRIEKIPLMFADPGDIGSFFGVELVSSRTNPLSSGGQYGGMSGMGGGMMGGGMMGGGMMGGGMMGGGYGGGGYGGGGYGGSSYGGGYGSSGGYGGYRSGF